MKNLKQLKHFIKVTKIACLTFSLIVAPSVMAQGAAPPNAFAAGVGSAIQQVTLAALSGMQQGPIVPMEVTKVPSKIFPGQCMVLPARTNLPVGACEGELPGASGGFLGQVAAIQASGQAQQIASMAQGKQISIEAMINLDTNDPATPNGLACLHREAKELQDKFVQKQQELEALIGRIDMNNKLFIEQNEARISAMADNAHLLYGSNYQGKANTSHLKLKDSFTAKCQELIGNSTFVASKQGLQGLNDAIMVPVAQSASTFQRNRNDYERQIKDQVDQLLSDFKNYGISAYNPQAGFSPKRGQNKFVGMDAAINAELEKFSKKYQTYNNLMNDYVGRNLPALDHKFESELERLSQNASNIYLKRAIDDCMTGRDGRGVPLTTQQILDSLVYIPTNNAGSSIESYKTALQTILNNNDYTMDQKVEEIKLLDQRIGGNVEINMHNYDGSNGSVTPYELYQNTLNICKAQITQPGAGGELALNEKVEEAQKLIDELKADKNRFIRTVDDKILDEVINCSGAPLSAGRCTVDGVGDMLNPGGDSFCLAHADQCSTDIKSCHKEAENEIKVKKDHTAILAEEYNNNMVALVAQQNQLAQQVQANILSLTTMVNQMIPGTAWEFQGESLAIAPPKPELVPDLGIHLRGAGNFQSIEQLKDRVRQLKQLLEDQSRKVDKEVNDYIALQERNMEEARSSWEELAEKCNQQLAQAAQQQAEQAAQQQQAAAEANAFCQDVHRATVQPSCGRVSALAGASLQAAQVHVGHVQRNAQAVEDDFCPDGNNASESNNSTSIPEVVGAGEQIKNLNDLCSSSNDFSSVRSTALRNLQNHLPSDLRSQWQAIESYVKGDTDTRPSGIASNDSFLRTHIEPLRQSLAEAKDTDLSSLLRSDEMSGFIANNRQSDEFQTLLGGEETVEGLSAIATSQGNVPEDQQDLNQNFCLRLRLQAISNSINGERDNTAVIERAEQMLDGDKDLRNTGISQVARGIASVAPERNGRSSVAGNVSASQSGAMGHRLSQVPCTNIAGNGNFGAGRPNPISAMDQRVLGAGNTGNLNSNLSQ